MRKQTLQAHPQRLVLDLTSVAGAYRGDAIAELQSTLPERQIAVKLHAINGEGLGRQAETVGALPRENTLERQIVDRHYGAGARALHVIQVYRCKTGLPVVAMDDMRPPGGKRRAGCREQRTHVGKQAKAQI